jgi:hypothetical protein
MYKDYYMFILRTYEMKIILKMNNPTYLSDISRKKNNRTLFFTSVIIKITLEAVNNLLQLPLGMMNVI